MAFKKSNSSAGEEFAARKRPPLGPTDQIDVNDIETLKYYITDYGKNTAGSANLDFGFTYLVHPRVQLDVYGAFNCQDPASSANVGLGVAWMIQ